MKLKHSKIKNTGIIFELLARQITQDALENIDSKAMNILKKFFSNTELAKEYKIYKTISSAKFLNENRANLLINSVVETQRKLNQGKLRKEKYSLISAIKEAYDLDNFFKAKIDNYKVYASAYLLFESDNNKDLINPSSVTDFKYTILEHITAKQEVKEKDEILEEFVNSDKETRFLIYKMLVEKFNERYNSSLNDKQKKLLKEFVNNVTTTTKLKDFINEELSAVKSDLKLLIPGISDPVLKIKVTQVAQIIKEIAKTKTVSDEDVVNLFNYYQLVEEIKTSSTK